MNIAEDFVDAVGHTPLIRLRTVSDETGCEIGRASCRERVYSGV